MAQRLSRNQRRLLVAGVYVGLICYPGMLLAFGDSPWALLGAGGLIASVVIHSWLLAPFTQRVAEKKGNELDER